MPMPHPPTERKQFTDQEAEVARLRANGMAWTRVAKALGITRDAAHGSGRKAELKIAFNAALDRGETGANAALGARPVLFPEDRPSSAPRVTELRQAEEAFAAMGLSKNLAAIAQRRLKALSGSLKNLKFPETTQALVKLMQQRQAMALIFLDEVAMAQASAKDLVVIITGLNKEIMLLKGQPTAIIGHHDRLKMAELGEAIKAEIDRRQNIIDVTPDAGNGEIKKKNG